MAAKHRNVVFSRQARPADAPSGVEFVSEAIGPFVGRLREQPGKDIWLMGGGEIIASFLDEGAIDEFVISVAPVFIGEGIPLIARRHRHVPLELHSVERFDDGLVQLHYRVQKDGRWQLHDRSRLERRRREHSRKECMSPRRVIGALVVVVAIFVAEVLVSTQTQALVVTHVAVVSVADGRLLPDSTVTISGDTITSITPDGTPARGARVVDGRGGFLIPGLWDMHAHMEATGASWLQLYLANGVTGIRDMGSALDMILGLRSATATGRVLGPRVFAAGPILDDAPGDWPFRMRVKSAEDGRTAVQLLKRRGVDLIKVHDHTPRDAFFAIVDEARRLQLPVAGHIPIGLTAEQVIDAGQGDIEHLANGELWKPCSGGQDYRADACRPFFEMLARRGVWSTPTLGAASEILTVGTVRSAIPADRMAYAGKSLRAMWAENQGPVTPEVIRAFSARAEVGAVVTSDMAKAGVGTLTGCDTMIAGFCVHDEMAAMVRGGMTPLGALQASTINPARYFGLERAVGSVAVGRRADLVLLERNPLVDIANVGRIRAVILAGRLLERADLDQLLAQVKLAAQQ